MTTSNKDKLQFSFFLVQVLKGFKISADIFSEYGSFQLISAFGLQSRLYMFHASVVNMCSV